MNVGAAGEGTRSCLCAFTVELVHRPGARQSSTTRNLISAGPRRSNALEHGLYLVTRNTRDVQHSGAAVFNPWADDPASCRLKKR